MVQPGLYGHPVPARSQRGDIATRFQTAYRDDELLGLVHDVAVVARPDDAATVSTRVWDRAREQAGHPNAPSARQVATRLNPAGRHVLSWPRIVELAMEANERVRRHALASARRRPEQHHLDIRHLEVALRRASQIVSQDSFGPDVYEAAVATGLDRVSAKLREQTSRQFPTVGQIERIARLNRESADKQDRERSDWDLALVLAGLGPRTAGQGGRSKTAMEPEEIVELYASLTGRLPSQGTAKDFAKHNGVALKAPSPDSAAGWNMMLAAYRAALREQGREVPGDPIRIPRGAAPVEIPEEIRSTLPPAYRRGHWQRDPDSMIAPMCDYLSTLAVGQTPTSRDYKTKQRGRRDWPSLNVIGLHHGGFEALVAKARAVG